MRERLAGIEHDQLRQACALHFALYQSTDRTFGSHLLKVLMAVEARPGQGHKQLARLDTTAVGAHTVKAAVASDQTGVKRHDQFAECH